MVEKSPEETQSRLPSGVKDPKNQSSGWVSRKRIWGQRSMGNLSLRQTPNNIHCLAATSISPDLNECRCSPWREGAGSSQRSASTFVVTAFLQYWPSSNYASRTLITHARSVMLIASQLVFFRNCFRMKTVLPLPTFCYGASSSNQLTRQQLHKWYKSVDKRLLFSKWRKSCNCLWISVTSQGTK